ncbi:SLBB domain-containing protein [Romeria aff. gracilis LEGE 07310]|uniref:SLBB domain-containing protein n=1 Tax=Vasconcelosia minhoensis LEGE 07310 TaxID=915328 RepID=A0A8J7AF50_9CYAN|nr:polysaccharide biosynthesis/export family protein [Romeria gracilis]MBE9076318.1 SLBB domain-containing protein [Romeria aff. gracilis LEGE 07310]
MVSGAGLLLAYPAQAQLPEINPGSSSGIDSEIDENGGLSPDVPAIPAANAEAQTSPLTPVFNDQGYVLGTGDRISINLLGIPDYSGEYQVLADGHINPPVIGPVAVGGMTVQQAKEEITQRYSVYVKRPVVTLSLLEARPVRIAIAGEVHRPGSYELNSTEEPGPATVTDVVQLAGGITQSANIREIQVFRTQPNRPGAAQLIDVNLWELLKTGDLSQDLALRDGDTVVIPTATALEASETAALASASFSPDVISINVVGEVESPGAVEVPPNTPLNQALLAAGGFTNRARTGTVELVRLNPDGTATQRTIEVDLAAGVNEENNPPLRPNDAVVVNRSGLARASDTTGAVLSPLFGILRLFSIF